VSPHFLGGLDGRWYGNVMADALQQARAGVFPVFLGQGEFMFNGAAHPFLTAPYLHNLGIVLDLLTLRTLTSIAVLHLAVVVTAMLAAAVCYFCLASLTFASRWLPWIFALLYVGGAAPAASVFGLEMYMTFTTFAWLPLVLYGNVRLLTKNDLAGCVWLAAGLALVWHCHAPVALWATMLTGSVQGLRLLARDFDPPSWRRALVGGLVFLGLTAFYIFSNAQITPKDAHGLSSFAVCGPALVLALAALVRWLATGNLRWLAPAAPALGVLFFSSRTYAGWMAGAYACGGLVLLAGRLMPFLAWRRWLPEALAIILVAGGLAGARFLPETDPVRVSLHAETINLLARIVYPHGLHFVSRQAIELGDVQPGFGALALIALGLPAVVFCSAWETRLLSLAGAALLTMLSLLPFPVARLLYDVVPDPVYAICTISLWLRYTPVLYVTAVFAGFSALAFVRPVWRSWWLVVPGAAAFLAASVADSSKFVSRGQQSVASEEQTAALYRTENAQLYRYAYDHLPIPGYQTNGVVDYHLESRLLDGRTLALLSDPVLGAPRENVITLATRQDPLSPGWFYLSPDLVIPAHGRLLLRFEFPGRDYNGTLVMKGRGFYRDYYFPMAGPTRKSFGVDPAQPKDLCLWNSTSEPQSIALIFIAAVPPESKQPFGDFAHVDIRPLNVDELQIRTLGLIPYRARVNVAAPVYLETPRVYIPGYRASVDGRSVPIEKSPEHLVMVRLTPGEHVVEVVFRGTILFRAMFVFTALVWLGLLVWIGRRFFGAREVLPATA
jgi:hypothetical protein